MAWIAPTVARGDPKLAAKMVDDVIDDYHDRGIHECVRGDYHNVEKYVVNATNVYALVRSLGQDRQ